MREKGRMQSWLCIKTSIATDPGTKTGVHYSPCALGAMQNQWRIAAVVRLVLASVRSIAGVNPAFMDISSGGSGHQGGSA